MYYIPSMENLPVLAFCSSSALVAEAKISGMVSGRQEHSKKSIPAR